jgi:hypothetical protein
MVVGRVAIALRRHPEMTAKPANETGALGITHRQRDIGNIALAVAQQATGGGHAPFGDELAP